MPRTLLTFVVATLLGMGSALAQEGGAGAGRIEVGAFPGGGMFFTGGSNSGGNFGNYALGGSFTVNMNRWVGVEGEVGGGIGIHQDLTFNETAFTNQKTPNMMAYNGNLVFSPMGSDRAVVPYATGGIGGLTMFNTTDVANLGVTTNETFFTGNLGGGLKWFSARHWGVRGDYRFITVRSKDTAPLFFGQQETRYGHRIYGGLVWTY